MSAPNTPLVVTEQPPPTTPSGRPVLSRGKSMNSAMIDRLNAKREIEAANQKAKSETETLVGKKEAAAMEQNGAKGKRKKKEPTPNSLRNLEEAIQRTAKMLGLEQPIPLRRKRDAAPKMVELQVVNDDGTVTIVKQRVEVVETEEFTGEYPPLPEHPLSRYELNRSIKRVATSLLIPEPSGLDKVDVAETDYERQKRLKEEKRQADKRQKLLDDAAREDARRAKEDAADARRVERMKRKRAMARQAKADPMLHAQIQQATLKPAAAQAAEEAKMQAVHEKSQKRDAEYQRREDEHRRHIRALKGGDDESEESDQDVETIKLLDETPQSAGDLDSADTSRPTSASKQVEPEQEPEEEEVDWGFYRSRTALWVDEHLANLPDQGDSDLSVLNNATDTISDHTFFSDASFVFAFVGMFFDTAAREIEYHFPLTLASNTGTIMRVLSTLCTLVLLYCLTRTHTLEFELDCIKASHLRQLRYWPAAKIIKYTCEMMLCCIHQPPFIGGSNDVTLDEKEWQIMYYSPIYVKPPFTVDNVWALVIYLRFYLLARVVANRVYTDGTKLMSLWSGFEFTTSFTVRSFLDGPSTVKFLFFISMLFLTVASYVYWVCERPLSLLHDSLQGSFYVIFTAFPRVGYGETFPATMCGRFVVTMVAFVGVLLQNNIVAAFMGFLTMMPYEVRMVDFITVTNLRFDVQNYASSVIAFFWLGYKKRRVITGSKRAFLARQQLFRVQMLLKIMDFKNKLTEYEEYATRMGNESFMRNKMWDVGNKIQRVAHFMLLRESTSVESLPIRNIVIENFLDILVPWTEEQKVERATHAKLMQKLTLRQQFAEEFPERVYNGIDNSDDEAELSFRDRSKEPQQENNKNWRTRALSLGSSASRDSPTDAMFEAMSTARSSRSVTSTIPAAEKGGSYFISLGGEYGIKIRVRERPKIDKLRMDLRVLHLRRTQSVLLARKLAAVRRQRRHDRRLNGGRQIDPVPRHAPWWSSGGVSSELALLNPPRVLSFFQSQEDFDAENSDVDSDEEEHRAKIAGGDPTALVFRQAAQDPNNLKRRKHAHSMLIQPARSDSAFGSLAPDRSDDAMSSEVALAVAAAKLKRQEIEMGSAAPVAHASRPSSQQSLLPNQQLSSRRQQKINSRQQQQQQHSEIMHSPGSERGFVERNGILVSARQEFSALSARVGSMSSRRMYSARNDVLPLTDHSPPISSRSHHSNLNDEVNAALEASPDASQRCSDFFTWLVQTLFRSPQGRRRYIGGVELSEEDFIAKFKLSRYRATALQFLDPQALELVLAEKAAKDKIENPNADTASEKEAELMELIQKKKEALVFQGRKTRANLMQFELAKAEVERQVRLDAERQKRVAAEIAAERAANMVNMAIDALLPYEVVPHFQRTLAPLHETEDTRTTDLHLGQRRRARARITAGLLEKYLNQRELRVLERRALRQAIVYENYRRQLAPPPPKPPLSPARPPTPDEKKHLHHHHHHLHPDLSAEKRHKPIPCVVSTSVIQDELETFLRAMLLEMQNTLGTILNLQDRLDDYDADLGATVSQIAALEHVR